jgi:hypothetical protein
MASVVVRRWIIAVGIVLVVLGLMTFVASLVVGYILDEYVSPPFSEQSVPPASRY